MIKMYKVQDIDWYIEVDTDKAEIIEQYHKPSVEATIAQIEKQLALLPDPKGKETYYSGIIALINASTSPAATKTAAVAFMAEMWQAYGLKQEQTEEAQLRARLASLKELVSRMV